MDKAGEWGGGGGSLLPRRVSLQRTAHGRTACCVFLYVDLNSTIPPHMNSKKMRKVVITTPPPPPQRVTPGLSSIAAKPRKTQSRSDLQSLQLETGVIVFKDVDELNHSGDLALMVDNYCGCDAPREISTQGDNFAALSSTHSVL